MIHVEKKFYYVHKPSNRFVVFDFYHWPYSFNDEGEYITISYVESNIYLIPDFDPEILFCAKNSIEEALEVSKYGVDAWVPDLNNNKNCLREKPPEFIFQPVKKEDFELKECIITYSSREN